MLLYNKTQHIQLPPRISKGSNLQLQDVIYPLQIQPCMNSTGPPSKTKFKIDKYSFPLPCLLPTWFLTPALLPLSLVPTSQPLNFRHQLRNPERLSHTIVHACLHGQFPLLLPRIRRHCYYRNVARDFALRFPRTDLCCGSQTIH